jgi:hypothetical protein
VPVPLNEHLARARRFAPLLLAATVIAALFARGLGFALLVVAAGMLLYAIASLWASVQSLSDDAELSLDEALALAAPSAEEEKKRSVLRALKDLEYERSVGKIGEDDYNKLTTRYRDEARRLLRELDEAEMPARARVEQRLAKRLEREALIAKEVPPDDGDDNDDDDDDGDARQTADDAQEGEEPPSSASPCAGCGTDNDSDARFCKQCGKGLS